MLETPYAPPTYTLQVGTEYAPPVKKQGLTKPELRQRIESFIRDDRALTFNIEVERGELADG